MITFIGNVQNRQTHAESRLAVGRANTAKGGKQEWGVSADGFKISLG